MSIHTTDTSQSYYLLIDSSTDVCTVALVTDDGNIVAEGTNPEPHRHAEKLPVLCQELLEQLPSTDQLVGVGISEGPGSYTGLRIGAAYVKGLCWALRVPLVTVSTPELLTLTYLSTHPMSSPDVIYMPMIDARRMEVYTALYTSSLEPVTSVAALVLTQQAEMDEWISHIPPHHQLIYFGSGAGKATDILSQTFPHGHYGGDTTPRAADMASVVISKLQQGATVDIAYWEPFYLKEYQAKISANKVLGQIKTD